MKIPPLSTRDRRALLVGASVLIPALFWGLVARPYVRAVERTSSNLAAERELLRREVVLLASADQFPAALEEGAAQLLEVASRLFGGENPSVTSATLAQYLQKAARSARVLLTRLEPVPAEEAGTGVIALPLRVRGETDLEGLLTLLHSLETGEKLVRVENLQIQGLRTTAPRSDDSEALSFEFTAAGFMLAEAEAAEPSADDEVAQ